MFHLWVLGRRRHCFGTIVSFRAGTKVFDLVPCFTLGFWVGEVTVPLNGRAVEGQLRFLHEKQSYRKNLHQLFLSSADLPSRKPLADLPSRKPLADPLLQEDLQEQKEERTTRRGLQGADHTARTSRLNTKAAT